MHKTATATVGTKQLLSIIMFNLFFLVWVICFRDEANSMWLFSEEFNVAIKQQSDDLGVEIGTLPTLDLVGVGGLLNSTWGIVGWWKEFQDFVNSTNTCSIEEAVDEEMDSVIFGVHWEVTGWCQV